MTLFWDVDSVLRDLSTAVLGFELPSWDYRHKGKHFCTLVEENLNVLEVARPLVFVNVLNEQRNAIILTHQPENWRPYTEKWLSHWIKVPHKIIFTSSVKEKEIYLKEKEDYLIDDYPLFSNYSQILLIDRPHNMHLQNIPNRIFSGNQLREKIKELSC